MLPYRDDKAERPVRCGVAFVALREDGAVLLRERPPQGLLGGMLEAPSTPWAESSPAIDGHAPIDGDWRKVPGRVEHTFTHFHLQLEVLRADVGLDADLNAAASPERCRWVPMRDLHAAALPSVMRKVLAHALEPGARRTRRRAQAPAAPARARRRSA